MIITLSGNPAVANECLDENSSSDEWYMPQKPAGSLPINILMNAPKYGFGNKISNALGPFEVNFFFL